MGPAAMAHPSTHNQPCDSGNWSTLVEMLRQRAERRPEQRAFTFLQDGEHEEVHWSYGELDRRARIIAGHLQECGIDGGRVLLLYPPGLEYIAGFFGALYAGAVAVPAYPPEPNRVKRTLPRVEAIVEDCQPSAVLTTQAVAMMASLLG